MSLRFRMSPPDGDGIPAPSPGGHDRAGGNQSPLAAALKPMRSAIALCVVALTLQPLIATAEGYRLGPQDKLRIKLVEWRPGNGEAVEWEALTDTYAVNASGRVSMPMLGEFAAGGRTPAELGSLIGEAMQKRVGLANRPEVSVEVDTYRSFYILGSVEKPGDYAFRPDVTALQAVGIAGGFYRPSDAGLLRLERDRINAQGLLEENRLALQRALVREARLVSELDGRVQVKLSPELDGKKLGTLVADEEALARVRLDTFDAQMKAAEGLKGLLDDQIRTLDAKIVSQAKQVDISKRELQSYSALTTQGLSVSSRQFGLERTVAETEGRKIDYEMAALNARQDRRKAEQAQVDLRNDRLTKLTGEVGDARAAAAEARAKITAQENLINEASVTTPGMLINREKTIQERRPVFLLTRSNTGDDRATTTVVTEATRLEPGDVLRVEMPSLFGGNRDQSERAERSTDRRSAIE